VASADLVGSGLAKPQMLDFAFLNTLGQFSPPLVQGRIVNSVDVVEINAVSAQFSERLFHRLAHVFGCVHYRDFTVDEGHASLRGKNDLVSIIRPFKLPTQLLFAAPLQLGRIPVIASEFKNFVQSLVDLFLG